MVMRCLIISLLVLPLALAFGQDEANDAQLQQYVQLLQPAMWRELDFVRQVCNLTPEQRPKVKAAADAAVKKAAKAITRPQGGVQSHPTAAAQMIRDSVADELKKSLTPQQLEHYADEDAGRTAARKDATIRSVVSKLDGAMYLTNEQREKIMAELNSSWERDWEKWLDMYQYGEQYFPEIPEKHVVPHLTDEQKIVWNGLQRTTIFGWNHGEQRQDDDWWNPKAAKKAKGKLAPAKGKGALLQPAKKS
jgi:hypothetical protein